MRGDAEAGHLVCPIDGCPDPAFWARGGSRRDHFYHRSTNGGHAPESLAHHTSKHLLAARLRELYPTSEIYPDTKETEDGARPDVLVVLADGEKVAYEVQMAALTGDEWQRRHDRYHDAGITDVWLFGGTRYLRSCRPVLTHWDDELALDEFVADEVMECRDLFLQVAAAWRPVLFIDPLEERIGMAHSEAVLAAQALRDRDISPPFPSHELQLRWTALNDCVATRGRVLPPGVHEQMREATARERKLRDTLEGYRARQRETEAARSAVMAAAQRGQQARAAALPAWRRERARWEEQLGAPLPTIVDEDSGHGEELYALTGDQWRAAILRVLSARPNAIVPTRVLLRTMRMCARAPGHSSWATRTGYEHLLRDFLLRLRTAGWVTFAGKTGPLATEGVCVLQTLESPPPPDFAEFYAVPPVRFQGGVGRLLTVDNGVPRAYTWLPAAKFTDTELYALWPEVARDPNIPRPV